MIGAGNASARPVVRSGHGTSRAATDRLLSDLRDRRWGPPAWGRFLIATGGRSIEQAATHRRALAHTTLLHGLFATAAPHARRRWVLVSWAMTATHLGLLESRSALGAANALTLVRANLPAYGAGLGRWLGVAAVLTDLSDGRLARRTGTATPFGRYADALADTAFWTWFALTDDDRRYRVAVALTWLAPVVLVTARSIHRGRMVEFPRPRILRPAVALQVLLAARAVVRRR